MIKETITIQDAVDVLNEALSLDSEAINALIKARVKCNEDLSNHPSIQIGVNDDGSYRVGLLGIINGLFGADDITQYGAIGAKMDDTTGQTIKFILMDNASKTQTSL